MVRYKSEDILTTFTLTEGTTPANLNNYTGIIVVIYNKINEVQEKYSKQPLTDFNSTDFINSDPTNGVFQIRMQAEDTKDWTSGEVFAEIKTQVTSSDWSSNSYHTIASGIALFELKDALTSTYLILSGSV